MNRLARAILVGLALILMLAIAGCEPIVIEKEVVVTATPDPQAEKAGSGDANEPLGPEEPSEETANSAEETANSAEEAGKEGEGVAGIPDVSLEPFEPEVGRLVFMGPAGQQGPYQSYVVNADGSGLTPVSEDLGETIYPSISPNGNQVVFVASSGATPGIYMTDLTTGETTELVTEDGVNVQPHWSPDGSQIAYVHSDESGENDGIWLMDANGENRRELVETGGKENLGSWSPDGTRIVFSNEDEDGSVSLWIIDVESGETTRLTENENGGVDSGPSWSPDGELIAFYSHNGQNDPPQIMTIRPDGTERRAVTDGSYPTVLPVWSPDGEWLLYTLMAERGRYDLVALHLERGEARLVPEVQGFATEWLEVDEPLAETDHTQGPKMSGVEVDPEVLADAPRKGSPDAPVKIIEFSDYQCPFCQRWQQTTLPKLEPYIEDGTVELIFVDFPLEDIHPAASPAAEAAHCVAEQGGDEAYWQYHDLLFENQSKWSSDESQTEAVLKELATEVGVDGDKVQACLESDQHMERVKAGLQEGGRLGVSGTPTFFINGNRLVGAQPFSAFEKFLP